MARPKRNSNRRSKSSGKSFKPRSPAPQPPSPPPSAPRQPVAPRLGLPPNSARSRAARLQSGWDSALEGGKRTPQEIFGRDLIPTADQRQERDAGRTSATSQARGQDVLIPEAEDRQVHVDPMDWWAIEMARQGNDVWLFDYQPTPSSNTSRPRTHAAGYMANTQTLRVRFRNGQVYGYYKVPRNVWRNFKRVKSPGRFINRVLNFYPYSPEPDLDQPTGLT